MNRRWGLRAKQATSGISALADDPRLDFGPRPHGRQTGVQPLDGPAGGVVQSSVHRSYLRIQHVQSADDQAVGIAKSAPDDWKLTDLGWIFSIAIFFLGASAAVLGR